MIVKTLLVGLVAAAGLGVCSGTASAATDVQTDVSSNWAGYAVGSATETPQSFTSVSGTWVQPAASCTPGSRTYSAFWVGLGGFSADSRALEQVGTAADCGPRGTSSAYLWYELVPAAPVNLKRKIAAGDTVSATVRATGTTIALQLRNLTRKTVFSKRLTFATPDLSSAEWIAEAPSGCDSPGDCRTLPLTNFGNVPFSGAVATAGGETGTVSDPAWTATAVQLQSDSGGFSRRFRVAGLAPAEERAHSRSRPTVPPRSPGSSRRRPRRPGGSPATTPSGAGAVELSRRRWSTEPARRLLCLVAGHRPGAATIILGVLVSSVAQPPLKSCGHAGTATPRPHPQSLGTVVLVAEDEPSLRLLYLIRLE